MRLIKNFLYSAFGNRFSERTLAAIGSRSQYQSRVTAHFMIPHLKGFARQSALNQFLSTPLVLLTEVFAEINLVSLVLVLDMMVLSRVLKSIQGIPCNMFTVRKISLQFSKSPQLNQKIFYSIQRISKIDLTVELVHIIRGYSQYSSKWNLIFQLLGGRVSFCKSIGYIFIALNTSQRVNSISIEAIADVMDGLEQSVLVAVVYRNDRGVDYLKVRNQNVFFFKLEINWTHSLRYNPRSSESPHAKISAPYDEWITRHLFLIYKSRKWNVSAPSVPSTERPKIVPVFP